jgi:hypothetical protein
MDGDFKSDVSRDSFGMLDDFASVRDLTYSLLQDASKKPSDYSLLSHFSRLLWQQGRVILDADLNEQVDILLHSLRSLARDLIGPQGGPAYYDEEQKGYTTGFALHNSDPEKFHIRPGHYYVDGILVSNEQHVAFEDQPYYLPLEKDLPAKGKSYLAYLDIWERQVTALENDLIREVALGESGPDTATRAQLVWQVKVLELDPEVYGDLSEDIKNILNLNNKNQRLLRYEAVNDLKRDLEDLKQSPARHRLAAKAKDSAEEDQNNACIIPPAASYRGPENQLYRVEIHREGSQGEATFAVSRENGSVLYHILSGQEGNTNTVTVVLDDLGRDDSRFALSEGDWVELVDEYNVLRGVPGPLYNVSAPPDPIAMTVTLTPANSKDPDAQGIGASQGQLLRLWNYRGSRVKNPKAGEAELADDGALKVKENTWFELENGIQIQFQPSKHRLLPGAMLYRTGDYWLIPARTITGNVIWPQQPPWQPPGSSTTSSPALLLPHGVRHHYAPLAYINPDGTIAENASLQYLFKSLVELSL